MLYFDAHNYLKRIYHGGGNPYALFYNLLINQAATEMEVVCDGRKSRNYRKNIHPGYKKGRDQGDDPIYWEVYNNCIELALCYKNVKVIHMDEGEADDYIALRADKGDAVISNDRDLWPLLNKGVAILLNATTKASYSDMFTKFNTKNPDHIYLYKTLVGDTSDKIPGKRGFGDKAWLKLSEPERVVLYKKLENGIADELLTDQALMCWKLARPFEGYTYDSELGVERDAFAFLTSKGVQL